jgi:uncharacterized membrane protein
LCFDFSGQPDVPHHLHRGTPRALGNDDELWEVINGSNTMERMLVAVFESEAKAYDGSRALQALEGDGTIAVYASRVVTRHEDGTTTVARIEDPLPDATMGGTAIGSLIGMLGGPVGLALGAATGVAIGAATDWTRARVDREFVSDVTSALAAGKAALVAEIDEESTAPADARLNALGGSVFRRELLDVEDSEYEREITTIKAHLARAEAEHEASRAERKRRLKANIDSLNEQLRQTLERQKARRDGVRREAVAKVQHLQAQAVNASQNIKNRQTARIAAVRRRYKEWFDHT